MEGSVAQERESSLVRPRTPEGISPLLSLNALERARQRGDCPLRSEENF